MTNKEQVYDERIAPLMTQILTICVEEKIAMVASFAIPNEEDAGLQCTSTLLSEDYLAPLPKSVRLNFLAAKSILYEGFLAFTRRM